MTTFYSKKNNALSKVATVGGIDNTTNPVTFAVTTGEGSKFPAANFVITIDNEILICTSRTGDNLTCSRAAESTSIAAHSQNADVENRITAATLVEHETAINGITDPSLDTYGLMKAFMGKQALINSNFDICQRVPTTTYTTDQTAAFTLDHWYDYLFKDGGTAPANIICSRQALTPGDIANAFYYYRFNPDGAGSSLGNNSVYETQQKIEHGTRLLCGNGKKVTVSFWARSSIANKTLGIKWIQNYGGGGSPTAQETLTGTVVALTSSWQKFTYTVTTNTLVGKTFGTNNDDSLRVFFSFYWGSTRNANYANTATTNLANGTIDIAQVQVCAGDVALPYMPKSYEEELRACKRFFQRYGYGVSGVSLGIGHGITTARIDVPFIFPVEMRVAPTCTYSGITANDSSAGETLSALNAGSLYSKDCCSLQFDCSSTATVDRIYKLITTGTTSYLDFLAEF